MMVEIQKYHEGNRTIETDIVAQEDPMEIRIEGIPTAVLLRTPEHDFDLVYGFLRTENVIEDATDIQAIAYVGPKHLTNTIDVILASGMSQNQKNNAHRNFFSTSSCGICGKASIDRIHQQCMIRTPPLDVSPKLILSLPNKMKEQQLHFQHTGGIHAAALFDMEGTCLVLREDIGRHNAVDKVIGHIIREEREEIFETSLLVVSGRAGFEIVQKAMVVGIPWLIAVGAPSSLAVELAQSGGLGLIGFLREKENRFNRYC